MMELKTKLEKELVNLYPDSEARFLSHLRSTALRKEKWDQSVVRDIVFDFRCPLNIPRGSKEITAFIDHIYYGMDAFEKIEAVGNFNNILSEVIFSKFENKVNIEKFGRKWKKKRSSGNRKYRSSAKA